MESKLSFLSAEWTRLLPTNADPVPHQLPAVDPDRHDSPWIHRPSGVTFMRGWNRVNAVDCRRYDETGNDVSVRYGLVGSLAISTYVFPLEDAAARDAAFFNAVRDMLNSLEDARAGEECDVAFAVGGHSLLRGRRVRAVGTPRGSRASRAVTIVEMYVRDPWAIKFRSTATPRSSALAERFFEEWLRSSRFGGPAIQPSAP